jgi:undecaprenyl diphosphate synthase
MGELGTLPERVQRELQDAIEKTKNNTGLNLNLALSYSGRWDIIQAVKGVAERVCSGEISPEDINDKLFSQYLATQNLPDPDLLIRSSGEFRISNFLLWQVAYTEIFIGNWYWPDFRRQNLYQAIADYQKRERRFGMVSEQIKQYRKRHVRSLVKTITGF